MYDIEGSQDFECEITEISIISPEHNELTDYFDSLSIHILKKQISMEFIVC